jgi:hypothetical protein
LGEEPAVLTQEVRALESGESLPSRRSRQSSFGVSSSANNFLYLISKRYFIKPWQVMELAPLLFCWAAEMSLRDRRDRLNRLEEAYETARGLENEIRHLPEPSVTNCDEKIAAKARSIGSHDIFGMCFSEDEFMAVGEFTDGDTENPFAVFLAKLVEDIDVARFEGFSPIDYPIFQVCHQEALQMAGGDEALAEHILDGVVDLDEMPKSLQGMFVRTEERAAWVRAQADAYIKAQVESSGCRKETTEAAP